MSTPASRRTPSPACKSRRPPLPPYFSPSNYGARHAFSEVHAQDFGGVNNDDFFAEQTAVFNVLPLSDIKHYEALAYRTRSAINRQRSKRAQKSAMLFFARLSYDQKIEFIMRSTMLADEHAKAGSVELLDQ